MRKSILSIILCIALIFCMVPSFSSAASDYSLLDTAKVYGTDWKDEFIVANINVKDEPFLAKGDGVTDDTAAIQNALNAAEAGGIVYIPAGHYVVKGNLHIPDQCTLIGDWDLPTKRDKKETVLLAYQGRGTDFGSPFIGIGTAGALKNISIYYPEQTPDDIQPYPYTIGFLGVSVLVEGVTLYNSYNGINTYMSSGSAQHIFHLYGTPLNLGVAFDMNLEVSELAYVRFDIDIWANSGMTGAPTTEEAKQKVRAHTEKSKAITCGRIDDMFLWDINVDPTYYKTGIYFYQNDSNDEVLKGGTYGHFFKLHDTNVYVQGISTFGVHLNIVDDIVNQNDMNYSMGRGKKTTKNTILSIKQAPYHAVGDGVTDDTQAIKQCIADIAQQGGGIVFIPRGQFKVTESIEVPSNVELRGIMPGPHTAFRKPCSQLNIYTNSSQNAAIVLSESSGVNGLSFFYPENKLTEMVAFPYTIRGNGNNIWIKSTTFINSYDAIDLASSQCDNFFVSNTWGTAMRYGIYVGGGSRGGVIENTLFSFGIWQETMALHGNPNLERMTTLFKQNSIAYVFENCTDLVGWSVFGFGNRIGTLFQDKDGKCADNVTLYRLGLDTPWCEASLKINNAGKVDIYGLSSASHRGPGILEAGNITGSVNIYGQNIWGGCINELKDSGKISVYSSINGFFDQSKNILVPIKDVTASSETYNTQFDKYCTTDPFRYTVWQPDEADSAPSLSFELETLQPIQSVVIYHNASYTGNTLSNAKEYTIQASEDNVKFKDILKVTDNIDTVAVHNIPKTHAKYFRIIFDNSAQEQPLGIGGVQFMTQELHRDIPESPTDENKHPLFDTKNKSPLFYTLMTIILVSVSAVVLAIVVLEISRRKKRKTQ